MSSTALSWSRDGRGRRVSTDGRYAVESDGFESSQSIAAGGDYEGFIGGEWAAIDLRTDETLDWYPTMREAKAECERHARRVSGEAI